MNRYTIGDYAAVFLTEYLGVVGSQSLWYGIAMVLLVLASVTFSILFFLAFCWLTSEFVGIRGKIIELFRKIPRETINDIHETLSKKTNDENASIGFSMVIKNRFYGVFHFFSKTVLTIPSFFLKLDMSFLLPCL